jgi:hypothetical protein
LLPKAEEMREYEEREERVEPMEKRRGKEKR